MRSTDKTGFGSATDFESLARQYWGAWGDAMRQAAPGAGLGGGLGAVNPGTQSWQDAIDWWTRLVHGGRQDANDVVERFNQQARNWYGQMQQVATQFAGQNAGAEEIARAWKQSLGAVGENPFPEMFRAMRGHGQQGLDQWIEDASPYLESWRREGASWLGMPAFGFAREHQERLQALAKAQMDYQQQNSAYNALMLKAGQDAYEIFERKLAEHSAPGQQIGSARALFDLWIDAAEEAYAQIALSPQFRKVYGELVNAQMRLRSGVQSEVEQMAAMFGMPTRTELDATHRKIVELERQVRRMRDAATAAEEANAGKVAAKPQAKAAANANAKAGAKATGKPASKPNKGKRA